MSDEKAITPLRKVVRVAVIMAVVAAVVALNIFACRRSQRTSQEENAVGNLRAYAQGQEIYRRVQNLRESGEGHQPYAHPFTVMYVPVECVGCPVQILDSAFAKATSPSTPKHGYYFVDMKTIGGKPIDWDKDFALCAIPAVYGRTGLRVFIVRTDGWVWGKDFGRAVEVTDYPANPAEEGWQPAD